jgi:membrane-associated protease RseP (regulator of RpoE activity)
MPEQQEDYYIPSYEEKPMKNRYLLHIGLFIATFITTLIAGTEWTTGRYGPFELDSLLKGLPYSIAIMFIISCHEFGHYFASLYHKVNATLPFYIPFPPIPIFINFGTMGAIIKTRTPIYTKKAMFDIGVAGPLAGFVACLIVLIYGFTILPGVDYILSIHPDYFTPEYGQNALGLTFGDNLLFTFLRFIFVDNGRFFPPMSEVYHYPYLCVGWFGLLITAMNMIPIGQLDGGHIGYTVFGEKIHNKIAYGAFFVLLFMGLMGVLNEAFGLSLAYGWSGWLVWATILFFVIKIKHPPIYDNTPLDNKRKFLGYLSYFIFIISFTPTPIY